MAGPAHGGDQQPTLLGEQRGSAREPPLPRIRYPVDHVDQLLSCQHTAPRGHVGPQPFLHPGDHDEIPLSAQRRVRTEHSDRIGLRPVIAADRWQRQGRDVVDQPTQGGSRRPVDVLLGDVEHLGD